MTYIVPPPPARYRWRTTRHGWVRHEHPILAALRLVSTGVLYVGCMVEIFVGLVIAYVVFNPAIRP